MPRCCPAVLVFSVVLFVTPMSPTAKAMAPIPDGVEPPRSSSNIEGCAEDGLPPSQIAVASAVEGSPTIPVVTPRPASGVEPGVSRIATHDQVAVQVSPDAATEMGDPSVRVTQELMEKTAGTLGDPMRYFQTLPGVQSGSDQRNDFMVRGGNPSENLFVVDGIEVPSVNQFALSDTTGGLVSIIDAEAISSMTLHNGAHDAGFSDRLSSVVEISTGGREGNSLNQPRGARREAEAGVSGAGGLMSWVLGDGKGSAGEGKGTLLVSERQSILSLFTHDIGIGGVPVYNNTLARGDWTLGPKDRVWGMSLTGIDSIAIKPSAADLQGTNPVNLNYRGWRNSTGVNWQHELSGKTFGVATVWNSEQAQSEVEYEPLLSPGPTYTEQTHDGASSAKFEVTSQARPWLMLSAGGIGTMRRVDYRLEQPLPLPSPYSTNAAGGNAVHIATAFSTPDVGGFVQTTLHGPDRFWPARGSRLTMGGRVQHWGFDGVTRLTPRAFLAVPLGDSRSVGFGYAEYAQMPAFLYLLAFPGNHGLQPIRARHTTLDLANVIRTDHLSLSFAAYEKRYADYPVAQQYPQLSLANVADTFGELFLLFPMMSKGRGTTDGAEASFAARAGNRLTVQLNLTYARSRFSGLDGVMRRGNFDIPLSGNANVVWRMGRGWVASARYAGASGRVFTPDNYKLSDEQDRDVFDLKSINGCRSTEYSRLDFRFEQSHALRGGTLTWHAGLQNALNHRNFYGVEFQPATKTQYEVDQTPTFPEVGVKWVR